MSLVSLRKWHAAYEAEFARTGVRFWQKRADEVARRIARLLLERSRLLAAARELADVIVDETRKDLSLWD